MKNDIPEPCSGDSRVYLSPPCVGEEERAAVMAAFDSRYVAPCGPMVDEFERRLAHLAGRRHAVAVASGTAAIDLAMAEHGIGPGWTVIAPTLTFIATVGPAYHRGAKLAFVDCDETGNIDVALLGEALRSCRGRCAVITVDLYGRCCDYDAVSRLCASCGAVFICDSAEAVGATRGAAPAGSAGEIGIYSFNGNKIVTTSGGGALLTDDPDVAARARKRSQQSREPFPWYQHEEVGYNYRMSNLLASVGLAQLGKLSGFVMRRREIKAAYARHFELLPAVDGENNWLAVALLKDSEARDAALAALAAANIEARPVWKPLHMQPVFAGCEVFGGKVAEELFARGICLPTGSGMTDSEVSRVVDVVCSTLPKALVLGMGRSGKAAAALLRGMGYDVRTLDGDAPFPSDFAAAKFEFAVVSPGIPPGHEWLAECRRLGIAVKSELQLGVEELRRRGVRMFAVTGSKGKSSVVKLVADALGGVPCGNYGVPVCEVARTFRGDCGFAVVEVSSFQLETTQLPADAFEAAAILNLQEDHIDRHGTVEAYHSLKRKLRGYASVFFECSAPDESELLRGSYFDNEILRVNGSIAAALMRAAGLGDEAIRDAFARFRPLPHRMSTVLVRDGVTYIDDSKATSIAALAAAVRMAPGRRVLLIAGGLPKGDDAKIAITPLRERVGKVYTIGRSAESFSLAWSGAVDCEVCGSLENAVAAAMRDAEEGDCVLLSPGAASFDQFRSFGERGDVFADLVKKGKTTK